MAGAAVEGSHDAEVVQRQAPVLGDEDVAGVRVAVEEAHHEEHVQVGVDQALGEHAALPRPVGGQPRAEDALLHHHGPAEEPVDDAGHGHVLPLAGDEREARGVARLLAQVDLAREARAQLLHDLGGAVALERRGEGGEHAHHQRQHAHVALHLELHPGPQDLHHHLAAVEGARRVHLGHARRGQGLGVEAREERRGGLPEGRLDLRHRRLHGEGPHRVLQAREGLEVVGREEVGAQRQVLPGLHEGRAQLLQQLGEAQRRRAAAHEPQAPAHQPAQAAGQAEEDLEGAAEGAAVTGTLPG
jgi:hypothetical protein